MIEKVGEGYHLELSADELGYITALLESCCGNLSYELFTRLSDTCRENSISFEWGEYFAPPYLMPRELPLP